MPTEIHYIKNLREERAATVERMRAVLDEARRENRGLTGEEKQTVERYDARIDELGTQVRQLEETRARELENDELRSGYAHIVQPSITGTTYGDDSNTQLRDLFSGRRPSMTVDMHGAATQRRAIRAGMEARDLLKSGATTGGNTVPTVLSSQLYDYLEHYSGIRQTNVTVLTVSSGAAFDLPTVTAHGTAAIVGEGTAGAEADPAFGKATLTFYKYMQLLQVSREMVEDTAVDLTGFIAKDMGRALGRVADTAWLTGSGTNAPTGALVKMGTAGTIQATSTGVPSYANLVDAAYSVNPLYQKNDASWLMRPAYGAAIRKLTDTTGRPIWEPSLQVGQPDTLLGYAVHYDPNFAAVGTAAGTAMAFGDWSPFVIGEVGGVRLDVSPDFAFSADMITYRATYRTASNLTDLTGALNKVLAPTT